MQLVVYAIASYYLFDLGIDHTEIGLDNSVENIVMHVYIFLRLAFIFPHILLQEVKVPIIIPELQNFLSNSHSSTSQWVWLLEP